MVAPKDPNPHAPAAMNSKGAYIYIYICENIFTNRQNAFIDLLSFAFVSDMFFKFFKY
jgi:hypothetical protein